MSTLEVRAAAAAFRGFAVAAELALGAAAVRPAALYLLVTVGNVPGALAGQVYGCSRQYVSRILREIEDRRDDPEFDARLSALEARLMGE